ncbi:MAG: hypothetical protein KA113_07300 [Syntrophaceae bacterium]|jgi:hypothetical protein|nr:hypothetical protein [Syntrophaceae bacterium]
MTAIEVLMKLPHLFRHADAAKYKGNANVFLTRVRDRGLVEQVMRGVYLNRLREPAPAIEEVACFLRTPSYISCEWALNRHGILLQAPTVCTVLTLEPSVGKSRNIRFGGVTIEFSKIAPRLFKDFETKDGFNLATPEKALLDTIHLRKRVPFADELELDRLDRKKLFDLAEEFPKVVQKRLKEMVRQNE